MTTSPPARADAEIVEYSHTPAQRTHTPAQHRQTPAQRTLTEAEGAEVAEDGRDTLGEEGYDPTPPKTPAPKEAVLRKL